MTAAFVYMTAANKSEALAIGRALVEERLVACVNILDAMTSVYRWQGRIEEAIETVLIAKTTEEAVPRVVERVKALHSYECPCVISWPVAQGNPDYLQWIHDESQA